VGADAPSDETAAGCFQADCVNEAWTTVGAAEPEGFEEALILGNRFGTTVFGPHLLGIGSYGTVQRNTNQIGLRTVREKLDLQLHGFGGRI
jgi:hypothetical protein